MLSTPLPIVEIDPPVAPVAVVIWLHGLGADGHDFEPIVPELRLPGELPIRFVFPHAPEMPVTAFGGQRARAWFDFDPGGGFDMAGLGRSTRQVHDLIQDEIDSGTPAERILLAGFSQGGVLALHTALYYPKRLAGILALSTFLADEESLGTKKAEVNAQIPILMCHGKQDMVLPVALGESAFATLKNAGYEVVWREYPMGHEVCLEQIQEISRWLQRVLGLQS
ncbi:alpha/beta hydrolase [Pseudohalioglobus lutimaris]|uniref:Carboxylesterase n=1 Tax=Pseudohalioglobus lutimaris TaxID=1737061 RepID=A0A2N5X804_9GAMM|nr:alpha/beta fold hydrolase [Pseudohalioglobus lutimaris]PLW70620.1 carboxylesterase [Pseudohalioglobus lutimaris]